MPSTAFAKIASICDTAGRSDDAGNGRFCRNLVEAAILSFASRVFGESEAPEAPDFTLPQVPNETKKQQGSGSRRNAAPNIAGKAAVSLSTNRIIYQKENQKMFWYNT